MEKLLDAITSGVVPILVMAMTAIVPAATTFLVTWLKAQAALQEQAVKAAIDHVDALRAPAMPLPNPIAKELAMQLVTDALKRPPSREKLSAKIDAGVEEKRRESVRPGAL